MGSFENDRRRAVGEKRRDPFIEDPPFAHRDQEGTEKDEEATGGTGAGAIPRSRGWGMRMWLRLEDR